MEELAKKEKVVVVVRQKETMMFFNEYFPGLTGKYQRRASPPYFEAGAMIISASIEERGRNGEGVKEVLFIKPPKSASARDNLFNISDTTEITDVLVAELVAETEVDDKQTYQNLFSPNKSFKKKVSSRRYWHLDSAPSYSTWKIVVEFSDKFMKEFVAVVYNIEREKMPGGKLHAAKKRL